VAALQRALLFFGAADAYPRDGQLGAIRPARFCLRHRIWRRWRFRDPHLAGPPPPCGGGAGFDL